MLGRQEQTLMGPRRKVRPRTFALLAVASGVLGLLAIRLTADQETPYVYEGKFQREFTAAFDGGRTATLHDLTDFDWDTVTIFGPFATGDLVNETVGAYVRDDNRYLAEMNQSAFVFCDGEPVSAHVIHFYDLAFYSESSVSVTYSADAVLRPQEGEVPPGEDRQMEIVEPSGTPVEPNCTS